MDLSMETVAGAPFNLHRDRPSARISRCTKRDPSSSKGTESSLRAAVTWGPSSVNRADTDAVSAPVRTSSLEVRSPRTARGWRR